MQLGRIFCHTYYIWNMPVQTWTYAPTVELSAPSWIERTDMVTGKALNVLLLWKPRSTGRMGHGLYRCRPFLLLRLVMIRPHLLYINFTPPWTLHRAVVFTPNLYARRQAILTEAYSLQILQKTLLNCWKRSSTLLVVSSQGLEPVSSPNNPGDVSAR